MLQKEAWFTDMSCNFYIEKNYKVAKKHSATIEAREKISTDLESLTFYKICDEFLAKFRNN
jgi:hypothetical protein